MTSARVLGNGRRGAVKIWVVSPSSGSLATLIAIRRASSRVSSCAAVRLAGSLYNTCSFSASPPVVVQTTKQAPLSLMTLERRGAARRISHSARPGATCRPHVHVFADDIRIFEDGVLIATHAPLEGRDQRTLDPTHRKVLPPRHRRRADSEHVVRRPGDQVARRPLDFYDAVARRLAGQGGAR